MQNLAERQRQKGKHRKREQKIKKHVEKSGESPHQMMLGNEKNHAVDYQLPAAPENPEFISESVRALLMLQIENMNIALAARNQGAKRFLNDDNELEWDIFDFKKVAFAIDIYNKCFLIYIRVIKEAKGVQLIDKIGGKIDGMDQMEVLQSMMTRLASAEIIDHYDYEAPNADS